MTIINIKIQKYLVVLITALFFLNNKALYASDLPKIRDLEIDPVSIQDSLDKNDLEISSKKVSDEKSVALKGEISELNTVVGKSQLIRFDEPVKRISIANPSLADLVLLSPQEMLLNGKAGGVTSLVIWGAKGDPLFFDLSVKTDSSLFLDAVKPLISNNDNINLKFTNDSNIILSGKAISVLLKNKIKSLADTYGFKLVDLSESLTPQVVLEVKVAEASRAFTTNLNKSYAITSAVNNFNFGVVPTTLTGKGAGSIFDNNGFKSFLYLPKQDFSSALTLAEKKGIIKILSEPKLVATNGNKASFNAGQEVPIPTGLDQNGNRSYGYKTIGVSVQFTPTIFEESGRISLNIAPEVSALDSTITIEQKDGSIVYGFRTRKAETTVELQNGQTLVIAGLLERTDDSTKTKLPLLGEIPILGDLFNSASFIKNETELMIFVTPRIVEPDNTVSEL